MRKIGVVLKKVSRILPNLAFKLRQAGSKEMPESFLKRIAITSFFLSLFFAVYFYYIITRRLEIYMFILFIILFLLLFAYLLKYPDVKIARREREIDKELLFGIRYLIIEIESGVPIYQALISLSKSYKRIGKYLKEILNKVELGTTLEIAIKEEVDLVPSKNLRRVLWQIYNSIHSGSDLSKSLSIALEQITEEEKISIIEYGRKLNPIAMMFLMIAIVLPSLGTAMIIVLAVFVGFQINLTLLIVIAIIMAFVQLMFIQMIKTSRPAVNL